MAVLTAPIFAQWGPTTGGQVAGVGPVVAPWLTPGFHIWAESMTGTIPSPGNVVRFFSWGTPAFFGISFGLAPLPIQTPIGITFLDPTQAIIVFAPASTVHSAKATYPVSIPSNPVFSGTTFYGQSIHLGLGWSLGPNAWGVYVQ